ncbi:cytochrome C biogenesis protein [Paucibacter sp. KBW04]|uniref:cytochrome c biogenesis CcdA family protein n=1 Tax=Paucibacter sp. KBW04 TaxID=2153361 RepID=UPI000F55F08B|nr:cytochrome c biogenesis CcdA family protein [Paucibacter sp. KBW04]RQO59939.1 cytochrome C biogenesis protein [Paucibacter sp. KBW04]
MLAWSELGLSVLAGSLTTLSPCVFPILPLVLGSALQRSRAAPLLMGLGMVLSFALMGLLLGVAGEALNLDPQVVRMASACLFVLFGLVMWVPALNAAFSRLGSPLASRADALGQGLDRHSLLGALLTGALLGLIWSPCAGPLLGTALSLVASEGGAGRGTLILGLFGLGAALPLVAAAYASRQGFGRVRQWVLAHGEQSKKGFAVLLMLMGLLVLSGADKWLETQVNQRLPDAWLNLTTRI